MEAAPSEPTVARGGGRGCRVQCPPPRSEQGGAQKINTLEGRRAAMAGNTKVRQNQECHRGIAALAGGRNLVKTDHVLCKHIVKHKISGKLLQQLRSVGRAAARGWVACRLAR